MPSLLHEALLLLFQNRPELVPELLTEALHVEVPPYTEVRVESTELTQVVPVEYRADLVVLLVDSKPVFATIVEAQLQKDERKRFTWPVYMTTLRARFEVPCAVLVVTPSASVARWAAEPIALGPGSVVRPLVLGPDAIPVVTERARAEAEPELALLSIMAHGKGQQAVEIAMAAVTGLDRIEDRELVMLYSDLINESLSEAARKALQMLPKGYQFQSELARNSFEKGRREGKLEGREEGKLEGREEGKLEGREEGKLEGREEGKLEGRAEGRAADIVVVLEARGLSVSSAERERILATRDLAVLDAWVRRAATVHATEALFD